ncbi:MAG TPA: nuclear transport factor 2 family protein [Planctomycetota bacterium]|nr:nuclear transport factor 2 family protein [Planctomycetota bacterium]
MSDILTVLERHLRSFVEGDLDRIMADYTEDSVLFTVDGPLTGRNPIRQLMSGLFKEFAQPGAHFEMRVQNVRGEAAHIVWTGETPTNRYEFATDTFVVRNGKIAYQSFAGKVVPRS